MIAHEMRVLRQEIRLILKNQQDFLETKDLSLGMYMPQAVSLRKLLLERRKGNMPLVQRCFGEKMMFHPIIKPQKSGDKPLLNEALSIFGVNPDDHPTKPGKTLLHETTLEVWSLPGLTVTDKEDDSSQQTVVTVGTPFDINSNVRLSLKEWLNQKIYIVNGEEIFLGQILNEVANLEGAHIPENLGKKSALYKSGNFLIAGMPYPVYVVVLTASYVASELLLLNPEMGKSINIDPRYDIMLTRIEAGKQKSTLSFMVNKWRNLSRPPLNKCVITY